MSTYTIEERGQAGMDFLDAEIPGWDEQIDLARLDMARPVDCLGGQICGRYSAFAKRVGMASRGPLTIAAFNPDSGVKGENEALTAEYRRRITGRRFDQGKLKPALLAV